MEIHEISQQFQILGSPAQITPLTLGHINDTFRIHNQNPTYPDYLLQRINHNIFPDIPLLMSNIQLVTEHLKKNTNSTYQSLSLISCKDGNYFFTDPQGNSWRMYLFFKDLRKFEAEEGLDNIYEGAKAFGHFLRELKTLPVDLIHPTLKDFHNVIFRLNQLKKAVAHGSEERAKQTKSWIDYIFAIAPQMTAIQTAGENGEIPLRITHNDTKFDNVLFDAQGKAKAVVDLDTIMPGYVHFDFGDGIRTSISRAAEDEKDLEKIQIDLDRFRAYSRGYLEATKDFLTPSELYYLPRSGALLAYIMGVRFLTDYLNRDVYYKIASPEHNFQRAKAQLELVKKQLHQLEHLTKIIQEI